MTSSSIVWFRLDLRLEDNPALKAAVERAGPVIPVFIWAPDEEIPWEMGGASRWWLHQSLKKLSEDLSKQGLSLVLRKGSSEDELKKLTDETGAQAIFWNRRYEPAIRERDQTLKQLFKQKGIQAESFNGNLLFEPWELQTQAKNPFQVFTPFWKAYLGRQMPSPHAFPENLIPYSGKIDSLRLEDFKLEPKIDWAKGMRENWEPGEAGARKELERFLNEEMQDYSLDRDRPDRSGTSRLSPHLHFGEITPGQIWKALKSLPPKKAAGGEVFLREVGWREFAHHLLYHFPHTPEKPLRGEFERFPWEKNRETLQAWQKGKTGYPLVDAGMRQLWATGWMHNRVRMVVASFLVKDLLIPWQEGARWFWDTLVDADLANNTLGWQWTAGCGADAAPYFRIFNPVSQGEKFDPEGDYVRKWVPELEKLGKEWIHRPWEAPDDVLQKAGIDLGKNYPAPMIDHGFARNRALNALKTIKKSAS